MGRILLIYNPTSGSVNMEKIEALAALLRLAGRSVEVYATRSAGDATTFLRQYPGELDVVAVAGGDGTINEAINGLAGRDNGDYRLALVPTGTANVMALELGYPRSATALAEVILEGEERECYFGRANNTRYALMVGVGYDAWVVRAVNSKLKQRIGRLAYLWSMLRQFPRYGSRRYRVTVDGLSFDAASVIINNGRLYGGSFVLTRRADLGEPLARVLMMRGYSRFQLLAFLLALALGMAEKLPFVHAVSGSHITVELETAAAGDEPVQVDGDVPEVLPLDVSVERHPVRVLVPA